MRSTGGNSRFAKAGVYWFIERLCFYQTFVLADCLSLRNPALLKPAKRWVQY